MATILKVVVGSQMWGTATATSDTDRKEVLMAPLRDVTNPFIQHDKATQKIKEGEDLTRYELMHFIRLCEKGNPTMLEVLYSPLVEKIDEVGQELRNQRAMFLNSGNTINATLGMGRSQLNRAASYEHDDPRIGKLYASTILSMDLTYNVVASRGHMGDIEPTKYRDFLLALKSGDTTCYHDALEVIVEKHTTLQGLEKIVQFHADRSTIADFCYYWYKEKDR